MTNSARSFWFTGAEIRMCDCGTDAWPPKPELEVYTDGDRRYAHCTECHKTWDVDTLKEVVNP